MKIFLKRLGIACIAVVALAAGAFYLLGDRLHRAEFWEGAIEDFEAADAEAFPAPGAILFTGSSSIRLWSTLEQDMAPFRVLNRGFGGAHMAHVVHFADRIIAPYAPRALVVYAGDNDIGAGKTPEQVEADFRTLVALVREARPGLPVYFLTIKPSRLRWKLWPLMQEANERIAAFAAGDDALHVIDVAGPMLELGLERGEGDAPPASLFAFDGLHLSDEGYALWSSVVRPRLLRDLAPD